MQIEDVILDPVQIGSWLSYMPYHDDLQLQEQLDNLTITPLYNKNGPIRFIYTKEIDQILKFIDDISQKIKIEDTETVIENEVFYTSKMEGSNTTRIRTSEIHNGSPIKEDNAYSEYMIKNGFAAVKLMNLYGNKINEEILIKVWKTLTENCRDNEELQGDRYRIGDIYVGSYIGADAKDIPNLMKQWITFYNSLLYNSKPFLKTVLLHFAFETIHPFCDGNGRLGRLLLNNFLIEQGVDSSKAVSFSMAIDKKRGLYDGAFLSAENEYNDCTPFITTMLQFIADSYITALETQKEKQGNKEIYVSKDFRYE